MKYIKVFETTSDYESALSELDRPNVSYIEATGDVYYNDASEPEITSISFVSFVEMKDTDTIEGGSGNTGDIIPLIYLDDEGMSPSISLNDMLKYWSVVEDNNGNDITSQCTFTLDGDWFYDDRELALSSEIGVDDNNTTHYGRVTAVYDEYGQNRQQATIEFNWYQTNVENDF